MNDSVKTELLAKLKEELVLFMSIVKWAALSMTVGVTAGSATALFLIWLDRGTAFYHGKAPYYYLLIAPAFFLSAVMVKYLSRDAGGHGTEKVIEAVHKRSGRMSLLVAPVKLIATLLTLIGGGSAGKEGPCAQISAGLASTLADVIRLDDADRKKLVICGISAGFAAVFGTPLAGALFAMEVLVLGMMFNEVLLPSLLAGIISCQTTRYWGVEYHFHHIGIPADFDAGLFLWALGAGVFFGLLGFLLVEFFKFFEFITRKSGLGPLQLSLIAGLLMSAVAVVASPIYCGLGEATIAAALKGEAVPPDAFAWKSLASALTLSGGGSGGILTPIFFIGSTAGSAFAQIFSLDPAIFAAIGLVALLAGTTNTPVASSFLSIELFGPAIGPYAAAACVISYIAIGHRSVYATQILGAVKSSSLIAPLMKTVESIESASLRPDAEKTLHELEHMSERLDPRSWSWRFHRDENGAKRPEDKENKNGKNGKSGEDGRIS